jgi:hypothetical protein
MPAVKIIVFLELEQKLLIYELKVLYRKAITVLASLFFRAIYLWYVSA